MTDNRQLQTLRVTGDNSPAQLPAKLQALEQAVAYLLGVVADTDYSNPLLADADQSTGAIETQDDLTVGGDLTLATGASVNEISTSTSLGTSDVKLVTQNAVKTYVDNQITGLSVPSTHDDLAGRNLDANHLQYLLISGTRAMTGQITLPGSAPTNDYHAVPKWYVDNEDAGYGWRLYKLTTQTLPDSTETDVTWDEGGAPMFDTSSFFGGAGTTVTMPATPGYYMICVRLGVNTVNPYDLVVRVYKNGSEMARAANPGSGSGATCSVNTIMYLAEGDDIKVTAYQGSGSSRTLSSGYIITEFSAIRCGYYNE